MGGQGFDKSFQRQLGTQSWILYGIGIFLILLRTYARLRRLRGITHLAADDWLMITAVPAFYTTLIVCLNVIVKGGGSNLYPPEQFDTFTEEDIKERIWGSKIVVVSEQAMLTTIWCLKACMLIMYHRMTVGTTHVKWVKWLAYYVVLGWVAVEIAFFTLCIPFKGYWGMPPPNPQCTTLEHYAMIQAVFNLSSDFVMLLIPLPMIVGLSLPLKQKLVLGIVFSLGTFVIIAAILTKYYNLSDVYDTAYMLWYTREASVAVYVANLPGIWPLMRENIRFLRSHTSYPSGSAPLPRYGNGTGTSKLQRSRHQTTSTGKMDDEVELGRASFTKSVSRSIHSSVKPLTDEERGAHFGAGGSTTRSGSSDSDIRALDTNTGGGWGKSMNLDIRVEREIEVERGSWDGRSRVGDAKEMFAESWELDSRGPKTRIEGPEGEIKK